MHAEREKGCGEERESERERKNREETRERARTSETKASTKKHIYICILLGDSGFLFACQE
jgi:hypothetical protein